MMMEMGPEMMMRPPKTEKSPKAGQIGRAKPLQKQRILTGIEIG